eukprot:scaffold98283_cov45-Phaeocystis_antarctica.AAC.2
MTHAPARELLQVDRLRVLARRRAAQLALISAVTSAVISAVTSAAQLAVEIDAAAGHAHLGEVLVTKTGTVLVLGHGISWCITSTGACAP